MDNTGFRQDPHAGDAAVLIAGALHPISSTPINKKGGHAAHKRFYLGSAAPIAALRKKDGACLVEAEGLSRPAELLGDLSHEA